MNGSNRLEKEDHRIRTSSLVDNAVGHLQDCCQRGLADQTACSWLFLRIKPTPSGYLLRKQAQQRGGVQFEPTGRPVHYISVGASGVRQLHEIVYIRAIWLKNATMFSFFVQVTLRAPSWLKPYLITGVKGDLLPIAREAIPLAQYARRP